MLARNSDGEWQVLEPMAELPPGGFVAMCGSDLAPVLGYERPLLVAATQPKLAGEPDAVCVTSRGDIVLVVSFFEQSHESALFRLLECAGALQGMDYQSFLATCDKVNEHDSLADWVDAHVDAPELEPAVLEMTVAESLRQGRFTMIAVVPDSNDRLTRPLRYLNSHGATSIFCYELAPFAAGSVQCIDAFHVEVGAREPGPLTLELSGGVFITSAAKNQGSQQAMLVGQLVEFLEARFPKVAYSGDLDLAKLEASVPGADGELRPMFTLDSTGAIVIEARELAPAVRVELVHGLGRVLGRNLGDPFQVGHEELSIEEHLNDETLMSSFLEMLGDMLKAIDGGSRGDSAQQSGDDEQHGDSNGDAGEDSLEFTQEEVGYNPHIVPARLQAL